MKVSEWTGFGELLLFWFKSHMSNRKRYVKVFDVRTKSSEKSKPYTNCTERQ